MDNVKAQIDALVKVSIGYPVNACVLTLLLDGCRNSEEGRRTCEAVTRGYQGQPIELIPVFFS